MLIDNDNTKNIKSDNLDALGVVNKSKLDVINSIKFNLESIPSSGSLNGSS